MSISEVKNDAEKRMQKVIENFKKELLRIRTGRASPALLDGITVDYYGTQVPINQVANISVPDARLVVIQPWDKSVLPAIEKAIQASDLGLNPQSDGNLIRLPIPPLSEERRKEIFKNCKKHGEESKVAIRNVRRDANEKLKKEQKEKLITEDEEKRGTEEIQKLTDRYVKMIDDILAQKEKEIMQV